MTPFTVQVTRIGDVSWPLQLYCRTASWYTTMARQTSITFVGNAIRRHYTSTKDFAAIFTKTPHQFLLVPGARIRSVNGRTIPPEWIIDDNYDISENMMLVDARWTETDFTIEEVD